MRAELLSIVNEVLYVFWFTIQAFGDVEASVRRPQASNLKQQHSTLPFSRNAMIVDVVRCFSLSLLSPVLSHTKEKAPTQPSGSHNVKREV